MSLMAGFRLLAADDLSGTGLRFVDGPIRSIPLIGPGGFFAFGGEFLCNLIISSFIWRTSC